MHSSFQTSTTGQMSDSILCFHLANSSVLNQQFLPLVSAAFLIKKQVSTHFPEVTVSFFSVTNLKSFSRRPSFYFFEKFSCSSSSHLFFSFVNEVVVPGRKGKYVTLTVLVKLLLVRGRLREVSLFTLPKAQCNQVWCAYLFPATLSHYDKLGL